MENGRRRGYFPHTSDPYQPCKQVKCNRLFASTTLFPLSGVGLPGFGCAGIVPVHPARTMLMTTSDAKVQTPIVFISMTGFVCPLVKPGVECVFFRSYSLTKKAIDLACRLRGK